MKKFRIPATLVFTLFLTANVVLAQTFPFSDHVGHKWQNGIEFVANRGIVEGYPDRTFQPDRTLNRAELLKVIVASSYPESSYNPYDGSQCFPDIDPTQWYTKYVCFGQAQGIVEGYPDSTFRPEVEVNFVEALKIMLIGMQVDLTSTNEDPWYQKYYDTAQSKYLIPEELTGQYDHDFSRAQAAEVIKRILSLDAEIVQPHYDMSEGGYEPGMVYLGYLQEGKALDLYLIADSNVSSYTASNVTFKIVGDNTIAYFYPDQPHQEEFTLDTITITSSFLVRTGEVHHVGTLYLMSDNPVTVMVE